MIPENPTEADVLAAAMDCDPVNYVSKIVSQVNHPFWKAACDLYIHTLEVRFSGLPPLGGPIGEEWDRTLEVTVTLPLPVEHILVTCTVNDPG